MKIVFSPMQSFPPSRDAAFYWHADVFDADAVRYPVRLMIEGIAIASFRASGDEPINDIVEAMYRNELKILLESGKLIPENPSAKLTTVFFANGHETTQIQLGDIVIYDTPDKMSSVAKQFGRR